MNNFSKEELNQLLHSIFKANNEDLPIAIKVRTMIDNYCEHEFMERLISSNSFIHIYTVGGGSGGKSDVTNETVGSTSTFSVSVPSLQEKGRLITCNKCQRIFYDNQ